MKRRRRQAALRRARRRSGDAAGASRAPATVALIAGAQASRRLPAGLVRLLGVDLVGGVLKPLLEVVDLAGLPLRDERLEDLLVGRARCLRRVRLAVRVVEHVEERLELRPEIELRGL